MVAASSGLVLVMNVGIVLGPPAAGLAISHLGAPALFGCLAVLQGATAALALYRLVAGEKPEETGTALPVGHTATAVQPPQPGGTGSAASGLSAYSDGRAAIHSADHSRPAAKFSARRRGS